MISRHLSNILTLFLGICVALFWIKVHPEALSFQEQNQMFLCTWDYFLNRASIPGGFADWLAEGLIQFYYHLIIGAVILALLLMIVQMECRAMLFQISSHYCRTKDEIASTSNLLSILPALLIFLYMGNADVLLTYPIAIAITLGAWLATSKSPLWIKILLTPILVWAIGPIAILYPVINLWQDIKHGCILIVLSIICMFISFRFLSSSQYPTFTLFWGINYYRIILLTKAAPWMQWIIPAAIAVLPGLQILIQRIARNWNRKIVSAAVTFISVCLILISTLYTPLLNHFYYPNAYAIMEQSYLVRRGKWNEILEKAKKWHKEKLPFASSSECCSAVNLALAMTNSMNEHFYDYPQSGPNGLLSTEYHNNLSGLPIMEAFYQMGLISEAMHYTFEAQESIPNHKKSARLTRRLAECNIILGDYKVADKYLLQLEQTLFYDDWARSARQCIYEGTEMQHATWGKLRSYCLTEDEYFWPTQAVVVIQKLYRHNKENYIAKQYLQAYVKLLNEE